MRGSCFYALFLVVEQECAVLTRVEMVEQTSKESFVEFETVWVLVHELVGSVKKLMKDG
jgi:hypothetical protein